MSNAIQKFQFHNHPIRIFPHENGVSFWAVAKDVADILGYTSAKDFTRQVPDSHKGRQKVPTPSGDQYMLCVDEAGLYRAVLRSNRPEAEPFMEWVTAEVLPAIRLTGRYDMQIQPEPFHPALYSEDVRYLQQTVRWLLARLEKYEGPEAIGRRVPVAFLRFEERPMHCINMGQPLLLGIDALALLETESPGYASPRMRLMAAGLNGAEHTVVLRLGDIARALEVPGRMVSRALGAPPQATSMSFITPLGMAALSARLPAFYEWFWRIAVPAVAALPSVRALPKGGAA